MSANQLLPHAMTQFQEGDWVRYRIEGYYVTKLVLAVRPDGDLVTGDHKHDSDNHIIDPDHTDVKEANQ